MEQKWLESQLEAGRSFEEIGRDIGRDGSTVAYWARKHGLHSTHADRYSARGAPDRTILESLAAGGASLAEIARGVDRSITTVRYWLERWDIERGQSPRRRRADPRVDPPVAEFACARHGRTKFRLEGRGYYRCRRCRQERVSQRRRRVKQILVEEAGGRCRLCGYDRCPAALQFHHLDPQQKTFMLSRRGATRGIAEARAEAQKCVLLCANCHAEVEAGYLTLNAEVRSLSA